MTGESLRILSIVSATVLTLSYLFLMAHLLNRRSGMDELSRRRMQEIQMLVQRQAEQLQMEMEHHHPRSDQHDHQKKDHQVQVEHHEDHGAPTAKPSPNNGHDPQGHATDNHKGSEKVDKGGSHKNHKDEKKSQQTNDHQKPADQGDSQMPAVHPVHGVSSALKRILLWTPFWDKPDYYVGFGRHPFQDMKCRNDMCELLFDRTMLDVSDAVVIHINNVGSATKDLPHRRFSRQSWVFLNLEPPYRTKPNLDAFGGIFNLSMTYRRDSDIPAPFGKTVPLTRDEQSNLNSDVDHATGKTRLVAWVVNECSTPSQRSWFSKELERFLPLDIYGKCGYFECNNCLDEIAKKYKFLLSFENCLCKDYVSEHAWEALKRGIVPVVLGAADYSSILPRRSYINVQEYSSIEQLADYIKTLHLSDKMYNEYFVWKKHYKVIYPYGLLGFCDLCERLHSDRSHSRVIHNLSEWYGESSNCVPVSEHFKHISEFPYKSKSVKHGDL